MINIQDPKYEAFLIKLIEALIDKVMDIQNPAVFREACCMAKGDAELGEFCRARLAIDSETFERLTQWKPPEPVIPLPPSPYLQFDPMANVLPMMSPERILDLANDIQVVGGLKRPIDMRCGRILDGRNRYIACVLLGAEPHFAEYTGEAPASHVVRENLLRRDLTPSQRAMAVAILLPKFEEEAKRRMRLSNANRATLPESAKGQARDHAATAANVSPRTVENAKKVIRKGITELKDAVTQGRIPVSTAARIASAPPEEQMAAIKSDGDPVRQPRQPDQPDQTNAPSQREPVAVGDPKSILAGFGRRFGLEKCAAAKFAVISAKTKSETESSFADAINRFDFDGQHELAILVVAPLPPESHVSQRQGNGRTATEVTDPEEMERIYRAYVKNGGDLSFEQIEKNDAFNLRRAHGNTARRVILKFEKIANKR